MSYSILPTVSPDAIQTTVPRRYLKFGFYLLCVFGALTTLSFFSGLGWDDIHAAGNWSPFVQEPPLPNLSSSPEYPPNYTEWHEIEEALPQHNRNLSFPEGKEGRYVYFSEHVKSAPILIHLIFWNTWWLMILPHNSGRMGERTPGAFLPGPVGLPRTEIVRDHFLSLPSVGAF